MTDAPGLVHSLMVRDEVKNTRTPCAYTQLLSSLKEEESDALRNAMEMCKQDKRVGRAKVYSFEWLASVLDQNGYPISSSTLARHANERCGCREV